MLPSSGLSGSIFDQVWHLAEFNSLTCNSLKPVENFKVFFPFEQKSIFLRGSDLHFGPNVLRSKVFALMIFRIIASIPINLTLPSFT